MVVLAPPARRRCDSRCGDPTPSREPLSVGVPEATLMAVAARAQSPGAVWFPGAVAMAPHELESPGSAPRQLRAGFGGGTLSAHQPGAGSENSAPRPVPGVAAEPLSPVMAEPLSALGSGASGGGGTRFTLYSPRAATLSPFRREILRTLNSRLGFFKDRILRLLNFVSDMDSFLEPVSYFLVPDGS